MLKPLKFLLSPILIGLGIAFLVLLIKPSLRPDFWPLGFPSNDQPEALTQAHLTFATGVQKSAPSVVTIYSESFNNQTSYPQRSTQELGSGVIMSKNGYILTNYHVINNADQVIIILADGRQFNNAQLVGFDTVTDLALLKIDALQLPTVPTDDSFTPQVGDVVLAIGNPLNLGQTITQGIISATGKQNIVQSSHTNLLQMDAAINVGNSGGALVNSNGILVGINSAQFTSKRNIEIQGIFFAVPYSIAKDVMDKLIKYGRVVRGYLGFSANPVDKSGIAIRDQLTPVAGMQIYNLDPLGPAWQAGLQDRDIIFKIDGEIVTDMQQNLEKIANTLPGTKIDFELMRDGKKKTIPVTVMELEPI
ncbi:trypsin-like peptidase domain-containing protein [Pseudoalteromonas denitrificans]|uniref:Serine protease DegS n=1 Tax=Pseudoalteromonas denitrificans DSM 6059 TaxID=1123010 RepID=A0A1I1R8B4_9GAMM|nr:trypsin-like peptidase domain-containing protein [Pseudoalteromonas denitrificans]SFD30559.1 serine protease DegS [Pseudoalteromonas denitrificans DSM 6059]